MATTQESDRSIDERGSQEQALGETVAQLMSVAARTAPSAENRQWVRPCWRSPVSFDLCREPGYERLDRQSRFLADMGAGALIENMALAAGTADFSLRAALRGSEDPVLASCWLESGGTECDLVAAMTDRCTNRRIYDGGALPSAAGVALAGEAERIDGVAITVLTCDQQRAAARLIGIAEGERLRSHILHHELYSSIRFDVGWRSAAPIGIAPGSLEIESMMRPAFRLLGSWPVCRAARWLGVPKAFGWRGGALLARSASAIVAIDSWLPGDEAPVAVGRALQRAWLRATQLGLAAQPLPAAALFALPWWQGPRSHVAKALANAWEGILPGRRPLMLLRVGRAASPSVRSGRPAPEVA